MNAAWYIAVPFNILISVPVGLAFYELDNQFICKMRQAKRYVKAMV